MENKFWEDEYNKLKKASDDLQKTLKDMIDASYLMQETLKLQGDVITEKNVIIDEQRVTINRLNELTERQCTNNKLMLDQMESQSQTIELQNELLASSTIVRLDDKYR